MRRLSRAALAAALASLSITAAFARAEDAATATPAQAAQPEAPPQRTEAANATATVEELHATLLELMKNAEQLGYQGRYDRIEPVVRKCFDLAFMARFSVGRHWKDLDAETRNRWVDAFRRMTTATYAARFDGYSGEHFEMLGQEPATQDTLFVRTRLVLPGEDDVDLVYRLRPTEAGWRIIDIYAKGTVSELALRRSEYSSILKREDFSALLASIDARIADLAAGRATE